MTKWEYYTIETFHNETLDTERLGKLGKEGWELAGVTSQPSGPGPLTHTTYYFKRPVPRERHYFNGTDVWSPPYFRRQPRRKP